MVEWVRLERPNEREGSSESSAPHSIVLTDGNALNSKRKFFLHATKNRLSDPSEISALDFKHEFRQFAICSVSQSIGDDRSIFFQLIENVIDTYHGKKTVSRSDHRCERPAQEAVSGVTFEVRFPRLAISGTPA